MEMARIARAGDRREAEALGLPLTVALRRSYRGSIVSWAVRMEGEGLAAVFGLGGSFLNDVADPWLVTSPLVEKYPFAFRRVSLAIVEKMLELAPRLENYVLADYGQACRFLRSLGFTLDEPEPYGPKKALFRKFWMAR